MGEERKKGFFGRWLGGEKNGVPKEASDESSVKEGEDTVSEITAEAKGDDVDTPSGVEMIASAPDNKDNLDSDSRAEADTPEVAPAIVPVVSQASPPAQPQEKKSWFSRLKSGLSKSSTKLADGITGIFTKRKLDDEAIEELEDLLIQSDLGVTMAMRITDRLASTRYDKEISDQEVKAVLAEEVEAILAPVAKPLTLSGAHKPEILLMVGVNGAGKTTTIGKFAKQFSEEGKTVMLAAGDTFRAAAIDQLKVWGERTGAEVVARAEGADASGLVYEALERARRVGTDVLMIDTAGRLQNKANLMAELEKIVRVIKKFDEAGPHHVLLTLDATTGQNAMNQVEIFEKTAGVTGLVMTKLDGSARGGILVAIADKFKLPIHAVGVGEGIDDMQPFKPAEFAAAIATVSQAESS